VKQSRQQSTKKAGPKKAAATSASPINKKRKGRPSKPKPSQDIIEDDEDDEDVSSDSDLEMSQRNSGGTEGAAASRGISYIFNIDRKVEEPELQF
jgi:hypothetical protein